MKVKFNYYLSLVLFFWIPIAHAELIWKADAANGKTNVTFNAEGFPSALSIEGKSNSGVKGTLGQKDRSLLGVFSFKLDTLETGISLRDRHMKEKFLETPKFPITQLKLKPVALPGNFNLKSGSAKNLPIKALLLLHGVEKEISGTSNLTSDGKNINFEVEFKVDTRQFKIPEASFSGISVKPIVSVHVISEMRVEGRSLAQK